MDSTSERPIEPETPPTVIQCQGTTFPSRQLGGGRTRRWLSRFRSWKFSLLQAKQTIPLEAFQKLMKQTEVWTSCVGKNTLDEAPQAYKKADEIINKLPETVEIIDHMKPVYNFKAPE